MTPIGWFWMSQAGFQLDTCYVDGPIKSDNNNPKKSWLLFAGIEKHCTVFTWSCSYLESTKILAAKTCFTISAEKKWNNFFQITQIRKSAFFCRCEIESCLQCKNFACKTTVYQILVSEANTALIQGEALCFSQCEI